MSEQPFTPEPWPEWDDYEGTVGVHHEVGVIQMDRYDYERAKPCVDAMQGIPDPAAYRKRADELMELHRLADRAEALLATPQPTEDGK